MSRSLIVGDVHATSDDLEDCRRLMSYVREIYFQERPDDLILLGDLYDSFALKSVVVERFWLELLSGLRGVILVGNHDRPGDQAAVGNAVQCHAGKGICVVDAPWGVGSVLFMPFYFDGQKFVEECRKHPAAHTVVGHQSTIGGKYDNGLPIEGGIDPSAFDPSAIPQRHCIMGHIHTPQTLGKVWYPGSPRWRDNVSDAGCSRSINLVEWTQDGYEVVKTFDTSAVCRRTIHVICEEGAPEPVVLSSPLDRIVVDVRGSSSYCALKRQEWADKGARIRVYVTDRPGPRISESRGIGVAWREWVDGYQSKGVAKSEAVRKLAIDRVSYGR